MSYKYTVQKRKSNRITYRVVGILCLITVALQAVTFFRGYVSHQMLTALFMVIASMYGIYMMRMSFRKQAFDITYTFDETQIKVEHKYGESIYTYDDVEYITMVTPDTNGIINMLNFKIKKDIYTIPFTMKKEYCEKIYNFVTPKTNKTENKEEQNNSTTFDQDNDFDQNNNKKEI